MSRAVLFAVLVLAGCSNTYQGTKIFGRSRCEGIPSSPATCYCKDGAALAIDNCKTNCDEPCAPHGGYARFAYGWPDGGAPR